MPVKKRRATVRARRRTRQYVDRFAGSESSRTQCARRVRAREGAQQHPDGAQPQRRTGRIGRYIRVRSRESVRYAG